MTVMFCDVKGFTRHCQRGMNFGGLLKVMNRHFSVMSAPVRTHGGIIDKYIGDAIMAYWGPALRRPGRQARLASLAAMDMRNVFRHCGLELPELLGVAQSPRSPFEIRIGIATGEALVGSIGSELMMSYTVMATRYIWPRASRALTRCMAATSSLPPALLRAPPMR